MSNNKRHWKDFLLRPLSKSVVTLVGGAFLIAGIIMMVTPGPGLVLIIAGLAILGREYHWARRWLERAREEMEKQKRKLLERGRK